MQLQPKENILLITPTLAGGGSERVLLNVAEGFAELGYTVHVVVLKNQVDFDVDSRVKLCVLDLPKIISNLRLLQNLFLKAFFYYYLHINGPFALIISNYQSRSGFLSKRVVGKVWYWLHTDYWSDFAKRAIFKPRQTDLSLIHI